MKIVSLNLNGLRSAQRRGLSTWLDETQPDVVCCQEIRVDEVFMRSEAGCWSDYQCVFSCAEKKGYSGVAIYCRNSVSTELLDPGWCRLGVCDNEGRVVGLRLHDMLVFSLYFPSGTSGEARQSCKYAFLEAFYDYFSTCRSYCTKILLCGDWNIAHQNIDIKNWRSNQKNSGFLPEERAWLSRFLADHQMVDVFRALYPEEPGYTWWSNRGRAYDHNVGWRIDYHIATPDLATRAVSARVYRETRLSDHAALMVEYDL